MSENVFITPNKPRSRLLSRITGHQSSTPAPGTKSPSALHIPATPYLARLGYGTGVNVYLYNRSPKAGKVMSPWAVKRVNKRHEKSEYAERLEKEAAILRTLNHPNIIGFRGFTKTVQDGPKNLVMEDGNESLGDLIERRKEEDDLPFPAQNIEIVISGVCSALDYLHTEQLIMHADIKSANILIKRDFETVKICDFGVTVKVDKSGKQLPGELYIGTDAWSPIEVILKTPVTTKADIFAFGLVIFETLALHSPHIDKLGGGQEPTNDSMSESFEGSFDDTAFQEALGTRPALPDTLDLDNSYKKVLEIFFGATMVENPATRPSAKQILEILEREDTGDDDSIMCVNMIGGDNDDDSMDESSFMEKSSYLEDSSCAIIDISDSANESSVLICEESPAAV